MQVAAAGAAGGRRVAREYQGSAMKCSGVATGVRLLGAGKAAGGALERKAWASAGYE